MEKEFNPLFLIASINIKHQTFHSAPFPFPLITLPKLQWNFNSPPSMAPNFKKISTPPRRFANS